MKLREHPRLERRSATFAWVAMREFPAKPLSGGDAKRCTGACNCLQSHSGIHLLITILSSFSRSMRRLLTA